MIVGHERCLEQSRSEMPAAVHTALAALASLDLDAMPDGPVPLGLDGLTATLFSAETKDMSARKPEAHVDNIDIHFVVSGEEGIGQIPLTPGAAARETSREGDNVFYETRASAPVLATLSRGDFVVAFPWDIHIPLCRTGSGTRVRKVVVKVPVAGLVP